MCGRRNQTRWISFTRSWYKTINERSTSWKRVARVIPAASASLSLSLSFSLSPSLFLFYFLFFPRLSFLTPARAVLFNRVSPLSLSLSLSVGFFRRRFCPVHSLVSLVYDRLSGAAMKINRACFRVMKSSSGRRLRSSVRENVSSRPRRLAIHGDSRKIDQTSWRAAIFTLGDGNWIRCFKGSARFAEIRDPATRDIYSI